jgi:hypothetical protein
MVLCVYQISNCTSILMQPNATINYSIFLKNFYSGVPVRIDRKEERRARAEMRACKRCKDDDVVMLCPSFVGFLSDDISIPSIFQKSSFYLYDLSSNMKVLVFTHNDTTSHFSLTFLR